MKKNTLYIFITAYLALLIQTPGRFVYGFTLMIELLFLIIIGSLTTFLIKKIKLDELSSFLLMLILISFTILFRQVLAISYTEIALTLGYILYFPTMSIFLLNNIFLNNQLSLRNLLLKNLKSASLFIVIGLLFFLFRDIAGYGTFTFFGKNHNIMEKIIFKSEGIGVFSFVASIPGALILSGLLLFIYMYASRKLRIIKNVEQQQ